MRRDVKVVRVLCPECLGDGEFETTTSDPQAIDPPTVLCGRCFGRGYVFVPVQESLGFPNTELPDDYDPFALEDTEDERDTCKV
jgi:hypothetical protein